jgi:hypothetical protein
VQVGVHLGLEDRQRPELVQLGRVRIEGEGAGDQRVEAGIVGLARGGGEIAARERAVLGADQDACSALGLPFQKVALGADVLARPAGERVEADGVALLDLGDASGAQVLRRASGSRCHCQVCSAAAGSSRCWSRKCRMKNDGVSGRAQKA